MLASSELLMQSLFVSLTNMDNQYLDTLLFRLKELKHQPNTRDRLTERYDDYRKEESHLNTALQLFHDKKLTGSISNTVYLTPEGERFLLNGGFTAEAKYQHEMLQVAKDSRKYAILACIIGVVAIILTVIFFVIEQK